jgi:hypothetical protein
MSLTIARDWAEFSEAINTARLPKLPELERLLQLAFYSGNASSLARLLSCPSEMHHSGRLAIDTDTVRTMKNELVSFAAEL